MECGGGIPGGTPGPTGGKFLGMPGWGPLGGGIPLGSPGGGILGGTLLCTQGGGVPCGKPLGPPGCNPAICGFRTAVL